MKLLSSFILTILTVYCNAQSNEFFGLWIGTAEYTIQTYEIMEIDDDFEDIIPFNEDGEIDSVMLKKQIKNDSIEKANKVVEPPVFTTDTNFYHVRILLELKENGEATIKKFGGQEENYTWSRTTLQNELRLELSEPLILKMDSSKHLSMIKVQKDSLLRKILFEPISPSAFDPTSDIKSILTQYSWEYSLYEQNSDVKSTFYFENDTLTIFVYETDSATYSTPGTWTIEEFSDHSFVFVRPSYISFYLHLTKLKMGKKPAITADYFNLKGYPFHTEYPNLLNYNLFGSELPSSKMISKTFKRLTGKWSATTQVFPVDESINEEVKNSFLTYEFQEDGFVLINFGGEVTHEYGTDVVNKNELLSWRLSNSGRLIIFEQGQNSELIGAISFLDRDTIEMRKDMMSLEGHLRENMIFKLERTN